ncbi:acyl-CoA dehydrogenase family protein [Pigmentiphaga soli]|uniref:Acyl-CoA dehydrogenase family protein n=1 Tax=Pigmentiphaga soli TaxID=1007095 RepID=A0ABP8GE21_9BURK
MSEVRDMLVDTASRILADHCTRAVREAAERGEWPAALWQALDDAGLTQAATAESRGGPGAELADAFGLLKTAAAYAAPLPLAETLLAEQMLAAAGLPPAKGPATVGPVVAGDRITLARAGAGWRLDGVAHRIPWARAAGAVVLAADCDGVPATVVLRRPPVAAHGANLAGEPRDTVDCGGLEVSEADVALGRGFDAARLRSLGALCRAAAISGALETMLQMAVDYAKDRVQFGRPIAKFQAVQQQAAELAGEVAAASAAAQAAVDALERGDARFETAAAKARAGEAVGIATAIAHQIHGAIGFTHEHALHWYSRRAWSWREEFGSEDEWSAWIGAEVARIGGEGLWRFLTAPHSTQHDGDTTR